MYLYLTWNRQKHAHSDVFIAFIAIHVHFEYVTFYSTISPHRAPSHMGTSSILYELFALKIGFSWCLVLVAICAMHSPIHRIQQCTSDNTKASRDRRISYPLAVLMHLFSCHRFFDSRKRYFDFHEFSVRFFFPASTRWCCCCSVAHRNSTI